MVVFETLGSSNDYIRKWDICAVSKADRIKANPLISSDKHWSPWHPSAVLCAYPQTKRCELFTTTDYPSYSLQIVDNETATAWSS